MLQVWKPFKEMTLLGTWPEMVWPRWAGWKAELPVTHVESNDNAYLVSVELPGFAPEEVKLNVEGNVLKLEAKHEAEEQEEGRTVRHYGEFRHSARLPENVNAEAIEAKMTNGMLTITLPKIAPTEEVPIEVQDEAA
jgi:HSP20 family protein